MNPGNKHAQRGFTLLELAVVVGLMVVILSLGLELYVVTQRGLEVQATKFEQMLAAREALHALKQDIRSARRVRTRSSTTQLVLEVPSVDPAGRITSGTDMLVYRVQKGTPPALLRSVRPAPGSARTRGERIITAGLDTFRFTVLPGGRLVTVAIADERTIRHRTTTLQWETTVALRNR